MKARLPLILAVSVWLGLFLALPVLAQRGQKSRQPVFNPDPQLYSRLDYRYIGPEGNRIIAVAGEPGNSNVIYAGAASGGIFKSTDGGHHWQPLFDKQPAASIGALAVAPSDVNVIWAGTGETFIRSNISIGNGIYKSTDGGATWQHMGLDKTGRIGRIVVHPANPDIVYVAALGTCYGPQQERGVYKTTDGGLTWQRVLFVDANTGAADIAMDPTNPRILLAGMWQIEMKTWVRKSGGPGSGLYLSKDGGATWQQLKGSGLPPAPWGKIGVGIAASDPDRMYALIETAQHDFAGVLFRSDNGGRTWQLISHDQEYTQRPHYYTRLAISPVDADEVYFMAHGVWKTTDGGRTASRLQGVGGDDHDMWIDPLNPHRMLVGNDGGIAISTDHGKSWYRPQLPTAQMYHVAVDDRIPYRVYGNRQDGPSRMGPSNSRTYGGIPIGMWQSVGGGECGFALPVPGNPDIVWASSYDGLLTRFDATTGHAREVRPWPDEPMGWPPADLKYRWNWTFPVHISPHNPDKVYVGSQYVHVATNGGQSWQVISPDLTTNNKALQVTSGGLTIDNIGVDYGCTLFAIAESPVQEGLLWTGSNDGQVHISRDGGKNWQNVSANLPGLPEALRDGAIISNIEPSRYAAGTAYLTVDLHRMNDRHPYVYKTTDYGRTWQKIVEGIPVSPFSYAHVIREDPHRQGMLYLGTENGLYLSWDDGSHWWPLQNNLPHAPVHWLVVQEHFNDLVVATYGRGFWIMDDITPLQQLNQDILTKKAHLFTLRPAYRFHPVSRSGRSVPTAADGQNPEYGASINYYLAAEADSVVITIRNDQGEVVHQTDGPVAAGIQRVMWNLRYERALEPKLRTLPYGMQPGRALPERLRDNEDGWRPLITWGYGGFEGPLVEPGTYTVEVVADGETMTTPLEVRKDPNTTGTLQDIARQTELALLIRDELSRVADMVNRLEWLRKQVDDALLLVEEVRNEEGYHLLQDFDSLCVSVESRLFQLTLTGTFADDLRGPTRLYSKLMNLAHQVQTADFPPTDQHYEVFNMHKAEMDDIARAYKEEVLPALHQLNPQLQKRNLPAIVEPQWPDDNP